MPAHQVTLFQGRPVLLDGFWGYVAFRGIFKGFQGNEPGDSRQIGAYGYSRDMPLERMLRDVRMFQVGGGTSQAQMNMVSRSVFKRKFDLRK